MRTGGSPWLGYLQSVELFNCWSLWFYSLIVEIHFFRFILESVAFPNNRKHSFFAKKYQWSIQGENVSVSQSITGTKLFQFDESIEQAKMTWSVGPSTSPHTRTLLVNTKYYTQCRHASSKNHPTGNQRKRTTPLIRETLYRQQLYTSLKDKKKSREMWHIIGVDILRAVSDDKIVFTNASRCYKSWPLAKNFCLDARGRE